MLGNLNLQNLKKKTNRSLEELRDITDDVDEAEFVPYACHYNAHTLLTKNGELMQTIKIVGFSFEAMTDEDKELRATVRQAVLDSLPSDDYAIWFHTIRSEKNINPGGTFPSEFARSVNEEWTTRNKWDKLFVNELFITIVIEGQSVSMANPQEFVRGIWPPIDRRYRERYLLESYEKLEATVNRMLEHLKIFGAKKLGLVEENGVFYSDILKFLGKIINLKESEWPVEDKDLSYQLSTSEITFGFNAMEVRTVDGRRRFGSLLTIKEYRELSLPLLDRFLQLPIEFIVTQCIDFINRDKALEGFQQQKKYAELGGDAQLPVISGINDIVGSDKGRPIDYGEQQLTVFLLADNLKQLEKYIETAITTLSQLGIVSVREDLKLEETYWSQLPANFEFVKRLMPINTSRVGGFASLYNFPSGKQEGSPWGNAVTVFFTAAHTPYFFNFHSGEMGGHTTILGPYGSGKTVLMNFLVCQAQKFQPRIIYFDKNHASEIFVRALGGEHFTPGVPMASGGMAMNPFQLEPNPNNRSFLASWLSVLVSDPMEGENDDTRSFGEWAVETIMNLPAAERRLSRLLEICRTQLPGVVPRLQPWVAGGAYGGFFDHAEDRLDWRLPVMGIELDANLRESAAVPAVMLYLLYRLTQSLDGRPTLVVFDEAWELVGNPYVGSRLAGLLQLMKRRNAVAILASEAMEHVVHNPATEIIFEQVATRIFLPNPDATEDFIESFGMTERELQYLRLMDVDERHFLIKRGGEVTIAEMNLKGMYDILAVLSATPDTLMLMHKSREKFGVEVENWLPKFRRRIQKAWEAVL
jgi:type IV secretion system protein VirB4